MLETIPLREKRSQLYALAILLVRGLVLVRAVRIGSSRLLLVAEAAEFRDVCAALLVSAGTRVFAWGWGYVWRVLLFLVLREVSTLDSFACPCSTIESFAAVLAFLRV